MKKRIYLALLPIAMFWCGCSEKESEHTREITAMASAADVTVSGSTRAPIDGTSFNGKKALVLATTTAGDYSTLHCNGNMIFDGTTDVARYVDVFSGNGWFPQEGGTIYLSGFYPHDGWEKPYPSHQYMVHEVDGKTDIMYAPQAPTEIEGTAATLWFGHQLTLLKIKLVKLGTAPILVHGVALIGMPALSENVPSICYIDANETQFPLSFGGENPALYCWLTDKETEVKFSDENIEPKKNNDAEVVAYILAPSLYGTEVEDSPVDYTFAVDFTVLGHRLTKEVYVDLKNKNGDDFAADTKGYSFEITLNFSIGDVSATAAITPWVDVTVNNGQMILPEIPSEATYQEPTGAVDDLTNCYMLEPGEELVFPVLRAYEGSSVSGFSTKLRSTGEEYDGGFSAKVLWKDADVMLAPPVVIGTGKDALVWVRTKSGVSGNAIVAIINNETTKIVWSYHIWVTAPMQTSFALNETPISYYNHGIFKYDLGDHCLGDWDDYYIPASLLYIWGRKDPFASHDIRYNSNGVTVVSTPDKDIEKYSIENPRTAFAHHENGYWPTEIGDDVGWYTDVQTKSIYDPCPGTARVIGRNITGQNLVPTDGKTFAYRDMPSNHVFTGNLMFFYTPTIWRIREDGSTIRYDADDIGYHTKELVQTETYRYSNNVIAWGWGEYTSPTFDCRKIEFYNYLNSGYEFINTTLPVRCEYLIRI
jgi:hypothetical protein